MGVEHNDDAAAINVLANVALQLYDPELGYLITFYHMVEAGVEHRQGLLVDPIRESDPVLAGGDAPRNAVALLDRHDLEPWIRRRPFVVDLQDVTARQTAPALKRRGVGTKGRYYLSWLDRSL